jgi:hypothetical protein
MALDAAEPASAASIPAAAQRSAISPELQRVTLLAWSRMVSIMVSILDRPGGTQATLDERAFGLGQLLGDVVFLC